MLIADLVDEPANLQLSWLDAKDWIVAPLESASHFNEELAERLSESFQLVECSQVFAIATEPLGEFPEGFLVDTSKEGLLSFHNKCCHFQFALWRPISDRRLCGVRLSSDSWHSGVCCMFGGWRCRCGMEGVQESSYRSLVGKGIPESCEEIRSFRTTAKIFELENTARFRIHRLRVEEITLAKFRLRPK